MKKTVLLLLILFFGEMSYAQPVYNQLDTVYFAPNNMGIWLSRRGTIAVNPNAYGSGLIWPATSRFSLVYQSSFILSGKIGDSLRVSGNYYWSNYRPGPISMTDTTERRYRMLRIHRKDSEANPDYADWIASQDAPHDPTGKPLFHGDSQVFYIMNDLDTAKMQFNFGTDPIGVEVHCLVWSFDNPILKDMMFIKNTYIHKGNDTLRRAFIGHWVDHEIGDSGDDQAGSDSLRLMTFGYGGNEIDQVYGMSPAIGAVMLQTPRMIGTQNDSARWGGGYRKGFSNHPLVYGVVPLKYSSAPGNQLSEPAFKNGASQWYSLLQGEGHGKPVLNPTTNTPTQWWYSGDPIARVGWNIDSFYQPSNKRMMISTGPFDYAPGDTQEVVIAYVAARAAKNTSAIQGLRDLAETAQAAHHFRLTMKETEVNIVSTNENETTLEFIAKGQAGETVSAQALSMKSDTLMTIPLFDDGMHGDGVANDGVYRATQTFQAQFDGVNVSFVVSSQGNPRYSLPGRLSVPLVGPVEINSMKIVDEYNDDGRVNAGEDLRLNHVVSNNTNLDVEGIFVDLPLDVPKPYPYYRTAYPVVPSHGSKPETDSVETDRTYLLSVPPEASIGTKYTWSFDIYQPRGNNYWSDTSSVFVDVPLREAYDALMIHVKGPSTQRLGVRIIEPSRLQDRTYVATFEGGYPNKRSVTLRDSLTGSILTHRFNLDTFEGRAPVQDGFRIVNGTVTAWRPLYEILSTSPLIDSLYYQPQFLLANELRYADYKDLVIRFGLPGQSVYRFVNKKYQGYVNQPVQAFTIEADGTRRQINAAVQLDSLFSTRITFFQSTYASSSMERYTQELPSPSTHDVIASISTKSRTLKELPVISDEMQLRPLIPATEEDVYIFNPRPFLVALRGEPSGFRLGSSYPSPFRDATAIPLDVDADGQVRLEIYDTLGRRIRIIHDAFTTKGRYMLFWDGHWDSGHKAESGLYFVHMTADGRTQSQPLMLIK